MPTLKLSSSQTANDLFDINYSLSGQQLVLTANDHTLDVQVLSYSSQQLSKGLIQGQGSLQYRDHQGIQKTEAFYSAVIPTADNQREIQLWFKGEVYRFQPQSKNASRGNHHANNTASSGNICASMPGKILSIAVKPGDTVSTGQALIIMESMKMEMTLEAPFEGTVESIHTEENTIANQGDCLVVLTPSETRAS